MDIVIYYSREQNYYSTKVVPQTDKGVRWCNRNLKLGFDKVYVIKGYTGPTIGNAIIDMMMAGLRIEAFEGKVEDDYVD